MNTKKRRHSDAFLGQMGDATNFVLVFAGELLQQAEYLMRMGLHPSEVIEGYRAAAKKAQEILDGVLLVCSSPLCLLVIYDMS